MYYIVQYVQQGRRLRVPTHTIQEVAEELRVHPWTVRRWIREGKIKAIRYGHRTVRITEDEFNRIKREGLK